MYKFKVGDKVKYVGNDAEHVDPHTDWAYNGDVVTIKEILWSDRVGCTSFVIEEEVKHGEWNYFGMDEGSWELVEGKPPFDLKTSPWYIRTNNEVEFIAAQKWCFEQGIGWCDGNNNTMCYSKYMKGFTNVSCLSDVSNSHMMWVGGEFSPHAQEIKLTFDTVVSNVEWPNSKEEIANDIAKEIEMASLRQQIVELSERLKKLENNS